MKIAICQSFRGKPDALDKETHILMSKSYINVDYSQSELIETVREGYAFCAQHKDNWRKSSNFTEAGFLAVDIDGGLTIEKALDDPFFRSFGGFLYTTANHSEQLPRFRLVFELENPITQATVMTTALAGLIAQIGSDKSCNDACRQFYGAIDCHTVSIGNTLSDIGLEKLLMLAEQNSRPSDVKGSNGNHRPTVRSHYLIDEYTLVRDALGTEHALKDLPPQTPIHCPVHTDHHPSAFTLLSKSGVPGVHCTVCAATYFTANESISYDFNYSLSNLDPLFKKPHTELIADNMVWSEVGIVSRNNTPYLPCHEIPRDLVMIKSPKGTGKTEWLKYTVEMCRANKQSVLLIGHRQSLIRSVAKRLGLVCYLNDTGTDRYHTPSSYFAICVDSLPALLNTRVHKYDVVLIDEVEQVFAHLTANTLKQRRNQAFLFFKHYIDVAKQVYALDADLSYLTFNTIYNFYGNKDRDPFVLINDHQPEQRQLDLYQDKNHLLNTLMYAVKDGERCFVCTNSKNEVKKIGKSIKDAFSHRKVLEITSDNSQSSEIQQFINQIAERILDYDVVIVSPSVGTGVDITFPDKQQLIDNVFGFFESGINTHFDIDQQIARVRHPKAIKVWISPRVFNFETDPEVIKREIKDTSKESDRLIGILPDGTHQYADDNGYLQVYADVTSQHRASKNNLRHHFITMKKYYGWTINEVMVDSNLSKGGKIIRRAANDALEAERIREISSAHIISHYEYNHLDWQRDTNTLTKQQEWAMRRYEIESFYRRTISEELVSFDDDGRKRQQIKEYEFYIADPNDLAEIDQSEYERKHHIADRRTLRQRQQMTQQL